MVILKPIQDPGQKNQYKSFSICHWNLDSTTTHGYAKLSLLKAYIIIIICLSKTNLDSSIQSDNNNLEIPGYNSVRSDHQSNNKLRGVCLYCKVSLPLRAINVCLLQESMTFKVMKVHKQCYLDKLELNNPFSFTLLVIGDLDVKQKK